jgi:hypothetical protein
MPVTIHPIRIAPGDAPPSEREEDGGELHDHERKSPP